MKHYGSYECRNLYTTELCTYERSVRVSVRDDWNGTYNSEESFISMEKFLQKHSYSLDSFLDRY